MSEETTQAAPEAVTNAPSGGQSTQDQTIKTTPAPAGEELADTWPEAEPEKDVGEGEADDEEKGEDDRPRKKSKSERLRLQNDRLKAEIAQLRSGSAQAAVQDDAGIAQEVAARVGPEPKEADFGGDWFAYERAMNAYEADKRQVTRQVKNEVKQASEANQAHVVELLDDYQENCAETAKTIPDFYQVVQQPTFQTSDLVKRLILDAGEKAPLIAYHLAKNPKNTAALNAMPPIEAAREMGRSEGRVSLPKPKTATSATPPFNQVKGSASPQRGLGKSMSDYERWRNSGN